MGVFNQTATHFHNRFCLFHPLFVALSYNFMSPALTLFVKGRKLLIEYFGSKNTCFAGVTFEKAAIGSDFFAAKQFKLFA